MFLGSLDLNRNPLHELFLDHGPAERVAVDGHRAVTLFGHATLVSPQRCMALRQRLKEIEERRESLSQWKRVPLWLRHHVARRGLLTTPPRVTRGREQAGGAVPR